jgi:PAS domain S-box-containing protein
MRLCILLVVFLGYGWAALAGGRFLLVEMGLLSFVAVTQCAPAILLGLVWPRGNRRGAFTGISAGFGLWFYTLIIPVLVNEGVLGPAVLEFGPFGQAWLRPTQLFGLTGLDSVSHGLFWSLLANLAGYALVSLATRQDAEERLQAAAFTGRFPGAPTMPVGAILTPRDIERLVHHYVGGPDAAIIASEILGTKAPDELTPPELLELRIRLEKRLAASLGSAAARFIVEDRFTLSKGEAERLVESFQELRHSLRTTEEEARRIERLLASVVRSVDDCIVTTDIGGRLVTVNAAGERLFGASEAELAGAPWWELLGAGAFAGYAGGAFNGAYAWKGDVRARTRGGRDFPAHLAVTPIFDPNGQVLGTVGVLRDLTEQHELQRRLIQQETLASLGQMAAGVAHEIRNPLGGIKMAMAVLAKHNGDALSREMTESMRTGVTEIESIVSHLLDYTRETRLDRQPFDVERIVREVVQGLGSDARARSVELSCSQTFRSGVLGLVDGPRVRQVVTNLVRNAIEAAERRAGGRVEVTCHGRNGAIVFEVVDDGIGMTPEERERMFLPFFTTKPTGTGLGLAIVKKIVDLHGGEIEVASEPGRGTRVAITLPVGALDEAASADRRG